MLLRLATCTAAIVLALGTAHSQPVINYESHELKEGRNYVQKLTAILSAGEPFGEATYSHSLEIPSGRGVTPELTLTYSSNSGPSEYGWGWELTLPLIERSTRNGVPVGGANAYRYRDGHASHELTFIATDAQGWETWREADDVTFPRYIRKPALNQWTVLRTDGTRLELGLSEAKRGTSPGSGFNSTQAWLVKTIQDPRGNYATYTYAADPYTSPPAMNSRISSIAYNGNVNTGQATNLTVSFTWVTNLGTTVPPASSYRSGYRRTFGQDRLDTIVVSAAHHDTTGNPAQVPANSPTSKTYRFQYTGTGVAQDSIFHLTSIQLDSYPATNFFYAPSWNEPTIDQSNTYIPDAGPFPADLGLTSIVPTGNGSNAVTKRQLADVDSDGRPDLIDTGDCATWIVWRNTGGAFQQRFWPAPKGGTAPPPDTCALRKVVTTSGYSADTAQDFLDIDGDAYPDIVYFPNVSPYRVAVCRGNGAGFEPCTYYGDNSSPSGGPFLRRESLTISNYQATIVDLVDVDADGRPELVNLDYSSGTLYVYRNLGYRFSDSPNLIQMPQCNYVGFPYCLRLSEAAVGSTGNRFLRVDLQDMNGDGIVDFIKADPGGSDHVLIAYGTGTSFGPFVTSLNHPGSSGAIGVGYQSSGGDYVELSGFHDINGDGMQDYVNFDCRNNNVSVVVRYNNGGYWDALPKSYSLGAAPSGYLWEPACLRRSEVRGSASVVSVASLVDMNGDGMLDFASTELDPNPIPPNNTFLVEVRQLSYRAPRKLITASSLSGHHTMQVTYAAKLGAVPYPIHAVDTLRRERTPLYAGEPARYTTDNRSYAYSATTYNRSNAEFAGFGDITTQADFGITRHTIYATGDTYRQPGRVLVESVSNVAGQGASETRINTYQTMPGSAPEHWITRLTQSERQLGNNERSTITQYTGYDDYGALTDWLELGDPATSQDNELHSRRYVARDDAECIFNALSTETVSAPGPGAGSTIRYYYDNRTMLGATPTLGELVKTEQERTAGTYIAREMFYDSYGNIVQETDPSGYANSYSYDPTYHLYRTSVSNSTGTTYHSYHALTGGMADTCGPRYISGSWSCTRTEEDSLGRVTATYVPTIVNNAFVLTPFTAVSYDDVTYPMRMTLTKRGVGRRVQYIDGFGNPAQVRIEETANEFRVYETSFDALQKPLRSELPRREVGTAFAHAPISTEAWTYAHDYVHDSIEVVTHPRNPGDNSPPASASRIVFPNRIEYTDEDGRRTTRYFDGHDRASSIERNGGAAGVARTSFSYDVDGRIISVRDPNSLTTTYNRNLLGWLTSVRTPDQATTTYTHDNRGLVLSKIDPRGVRIDYTYDTAGRLTRALSSNEPVGVRRVDAGWAYYDPSICQCSQYLGWLSSESSDGIEYTYTYNPEGQVKAQSAYVNRVLKGTVTFGYDTGGLLGSVLYPNGMLIGYSHNLDDSVSEVRDSATQQVYGTFLYEDDGQISSVTSSLGLSEDYTYDARGRLTQLASANTHNSLGDLVDDRFAWTPSSHMSRLERHGLAPGQIQRVNPDVLVVGLDTFGRVNSVTKNGLAFANYSYDLAGRVLGFREDSSGGTSTSTYSSDKLTSRAPGPANNTTQYWTYDAAGNATQYYVKKGAQTQSQYTVNHTWDALGRYASTQNAAGTTTYYYAPTGTLSEVVSPGEGSSTANALNWGDWTQFDLTASTWTNLVRANGLVIAQSSGTTFEVPHRTLGKTVAAVTNSLGQVIRQEEFAPYGARAAGSNGGKVDQHFHGLRTDKVLVAGTRAYDAKAGSWLGRDQLVLAAPDSLLRDERLAGMYGFNYQDPYRYTDSTGNEPEAEEDEEVVEPAHSPKGRNLSEPEQLRRRNRTPEQVENERLGRDPIRTGVSRQVPQRPSRFSNAVEPAPVMNPEPEYTVPTCTGGCGGFSTGRAPMEAVIYVVRGDQVIYEEVWRSGNMTKEEKELGFPLNSLATHVESRFSRLGIMSGGFRRGDTAFIIGEYAPCTACRGAMNRAQRATGVDIIYQWGNETWAANTRPPSYYNSR